ncbi:hypothetical protein CL622_05610 [archaeon]|nr:hypothetical protein [archaeon]|tara:strand:+ start:85 stop:375 length:291 start_codon:yes stop_codon:yes gene_type:complete
MKRRQFKKLCKKAAQLFSLKRCGVDDGIWYVNWHCGGFEDEWDSEDAWPYLVNIFHSEVNTMIGYNSECGISWKPDNLFTKATPKNVLAWARTQEL